MNLPLIKYSKFYYALSGILIIASIAFLVIFGLKFGIEFIGGSNMEIEFSQTRPNNEEISKSLAQFNLGEIIIQPTGTNGAVLKFKGIDEATHQNILSEINKLSVVEEKGFHYIGPSVGRELKNKTIIAIVLALLAITLYIAFAFRKVSKPVASWKYGVASLVALFHDILIPLGIFAILGKFYNTEITIPIIAALLTILGFSVHDTIVIFDRIRENIMRRGTGEFQDIVNLSLNQTIGRSISTVITVLLMMFSLFIFGGETLKYFSLALIIGIASGTYSSIFIASPLLVTWYLVNERKSSN
ncbi:MAG: protein translocase subunit SecF [Candidatus Staskawiczbacteria bacterium]|nr:protein translocase subunit SecF [Candidatus Staskawiczbacteria bacterium]